MFEFAVYEELRSVINDDKVSKSTTKTIFDQIKKETEIVEWKTKTGSKKRMGITIYDILIDNKFPDGKVNELTDSIRTKTSVWQYYHKYTLIRSSRRRKTSEIIVKRDCKVIVRAPFDKPISDIEGFIQKNAKWILKKQLQYNNETPRQIIDPTYQEDSTLPYLGKNYPLRITNHQENKENKFEFVNEEEFLVYLGMNSKASNRRIKSLYEGWLMQKARPIFEEKVKRYSIRLAVEPSKIIIKNLKSRWGSATKGNVINLNVNLLKASEDVIDYVVLHELCHLKIKEHSHRFWDLMHRFMPNYQDKIDWLKVNESGILHGHLRGD